MKKIMMFLAIFILIVNIASASNSKVTVLDLHYKDGIITLNEKLTKIGYSPDRNIQTDKGYKAEILSFDDSILYSFKFEVPLKIYTDVIDNVGEISGGIIVLNETNFALVVPYFESAKEIRFYDRKDTLTNSANIAPALSPINKKTVFPLIFLALITLLIIIRKKNKK